MLSLSPGGMQRIAWTPRSLWVGLRHWPPAGKRTFGGRAESGRLRGRFGVELTLGNFDGLFRSWRVLR